MDMNEKLKYTFEKYKDYLKKNDFDGFFDKCYANIDKYGISIDPNIASIKDIKEFLDKNNIDYLHRMSYIPGSFYGGSDIQQITIPNNITEIKDGAFIYCENLQSVKLPETLKNLEKDVFYGCSKLKSINIPSGIKEIPESAFYYCKSLKKISIPSSVVYIDYGAFTESGLREITIPKSVERLGDRIFFQCKNLKKIYVPKELYDNYGRHQLLIHFFANANYDGEIIQY